MMLDGISILIVAYNSGRELAECCRSVIANIRVNHEIILIDNSPVTSELVQDLVSLHSLFLISLSHNPGYGAAINAGAKVAAFANLLIINPDAVLRSYVDQELLSQLSGDTGVLSGRCVDQQGAYKHTAGFFPTNPLRLLSFKRRLNFRGELSKGVFSANVIDIDYAEGSLYLIQKKRFDLVRGFDEAIFLYGEDYEFSYRLHIAGFQNRYCSTLDYSHVGGFTKEREPHLVRGLLFFSKKHKGLLWSAPVRAVLAIRYLLLYAKALLKRNMAEKKIFEKCLVLVLRS